MTAGTLDQRVTFLRKEQVRQPDGTLQTEEVEIKSVWAEVKPKSGMQRNMAQQTENPADFEIKVRNTETTRGIRASDLVRWRGETMNITWAPPASPRQMYLHMDAKQGVAV